MNNRARLYSALLAMVATAGMVGFNWISGSGAAPVDPLPEPVVSEQESLLHRQAIRPDAPSQPTVLDATVVPHEVPATSPYTASTAEGFHSYVGDNGAASPGDSPKVEFLPIPILGMPDSLQGGMQGSIYR